MGNVICAIQSILTGLGEFDVYYKRIEDALAQDPNRMVVYTIVNTRERVYKE